MLGIVDCTIVGSAKNCLVFGEEAIYFHNPWDTQPARGMVRYSHFPSRRLVASDKHTLDLGNEEYVNFSMARCPLSIVTGLLQTIKNLIEGNRPGEEDALQSFSLPRCPKCGSTSLRLGETGYGWGTGGAVAILFGPLAAHIAASMREGKTALVCQMCANKWRPGTKELNEFLKILENQKQAG